MVKTARAVQSRVRPCRVETTTVGLHFVSAAAGLESLVLVRARDDAVVSGGGRTRGLMGFQWSGRTGRGWEGCACVYWVWWYRCQTAGRLRLGHPSRVQMSGLELQRAIGMRPHVRGGMKRHAVR